MLSSRKAKVSRLVRGIFKKAPRTTATSETLIALEATLTILTASLDGVPVPGLKGALRGLLAVITAFRVSISIAGIIQLSMPIDLAFQNVQSNREDIEGLIGSLNHIRLNVTEPLKESALRNPEFVTQSLQSRVDALAA